MWSSTETRERCARRMYMRPRPSMGSQKGSEFALVKDPRRAKEMREQLTDFWLMDWMASVRHSANVSSEGEQPEDEK